MEFLWCGVFPYSSIRMLEPVGVGVGVVVLVIRHRSRSRSRG